MARTNNLSNFLTDVADAIRTKKGSEEPIAAADFDTEIENLPGGGGTEDAVSKDVNFYDYDGTRIYSYSKDDFLALEAMPANPEHDGLTAQGWNWTFAQATSYVQKYGLLDVGQNYITNDGATKIYIDLDDNEMLSLIVYFYATHIGDLTIDWGDETTTDISITNITGQKQATHTYQQIGKYKVSLLCTNDAAIQLRGAGSSANNQFFRDRNARYSTGVGYFMQKIYKIEIGNDITFTDKAFANLSNLKEISIPTSYTPSTAEFQNDGYLQCICLPSSSMSIPSQYVQNCKSIKAFPLPYGITNPVVGVGRVRRITVPDTVTSTSFSLSGTQTVEEAVIPSNITTVGSGLIATNSSLKKIVLGGGITSFQANCFVQNFSCFLYDFTNYSFIPTIAAGVFDNTNYVSARMKIVVPDNLYEDWIVAENWSTYADYIISKSDWDALQNA